MTDLEFKELHKDCARTLTEYMLEAERTCEMLGEAKIGPSGLTVRSDILSQRIRENDAYARFIEVRHFLFGLVHRGFDDTNWPRAE